MIELTGRTLTIEDVVAAARRGKRVAPLGDAVREGMKSSCAWVTQFVSKGDGAIYGVNTGVGSLATKRIEPEQARWLSRNIVLSTVAGVGKPLPVELVRAMMLIRANTLVKGHSGVRPVVAQTLADMLNAGVTPLVPEKGSVGASGDLAPLAHVAAVLTRDPEGAPPEADYSGRAWLDGRLLTGAGAMAQAGIPRLVLEAKEGLALVNGTALMTAAGSLAVYDAEELLRHAELAAALSFEALLALSPALDPALHVASGQPGNEKTAANLRALLAGSRLVDSAPERVQDAYSLRCTPQVLGPIRDVLAFLRERFTGSINSANDNPLIFHEPTRAVSGGNFHGQGPAMWLDFLGIAIAEAASIAERRIFRMITPELSAGLPPMLVRESGLNGGFMIPHTTATALVSDNKTLAHPDSVDSIPSSANQEDHVSMGANAARHALEILDNVRYVIAIEFLAAAQAIDLRPGGPEKLGRGTRPAYAAVRKRAAFVERDRQLTPDIEAMTELIRSGELIRAVPCGA